MTRLSRPSFDFYARIPTLRRPFLPKHRPTVLGGRPPTLSEREEVLCHLLLAEALSITQIACSEKTSRCPALILPIPPHLHRRNHWYLDHWLAVGPPDAPTSHTCAFVMPHVSIYEISHTDVASPTDTTKVEIDTTTRVSPAIQTKAKPFFLSFVSAKQHHTRTSLFPVIPPVGISHQSIPTSVL